MVKWTGKDRRIEMKYVLVTGAFGGMGKKTVKMLSENGYGVFALDKRVEETGLENVIPIEADTTDPKSVTGALMTVRKSAEELFAVIHFAGVYLLGSLVEMTDADFEKIMRVNLFGAFYVNKTFLPLLKNGSRIVMTTSELAPLDPLPFTGIYAVSKKALDSYAYSLRMELQLLGISVSVIRAGAVKTDMLEVSTSALDRFCSKTALYSCNARRFKAIVDSVEARAIDAEKIAKRVLRILSSPAPKFAWKINRNPLLLLLDVLPQSLRFLIIKTVLKP